MFRKDIFPAWEDPINQHGGDFSFKLMDFKLEKLDELWKELLFFTIGENYNDGKTNHS